MRLIILLSVLTLFSNSCINRSPTLPDKAANLRVYKNVDVKNFSFMIDERYLQKIDVEQLSDEHPQLKVPVEVLLNKKLKGYDYCIDEKGKPSYTIIGKQDTVYEEILTSKNDLIGKGGTSRQVIVPFTYFGNCSKCESDSLNQ